MSVQLRVFGYDFHVDLLSMFLAGLFIYIVSRIKMLIDGDRAVGRIPGLRVPFQPLAMPGAVLPTTWWNPGLYFPWLCRMRLYKKFASENVSIVPFVSGLPGIYTSNLDVARQVSAGGHKSCFIKPESASQSLLQWGMNLVAAEGETWRKHRHILGPAFNNELYRMVWSHTLETYREMISAEGLGENDVTDVPVVQALTFKLALLIIGKCGFGFAFTWSAPPKAPDGSMSVQQALHVMAISPVITTFLPEWIQRLPFPRLKEVRLAQEQLMGFMRAQVARRKTEFQGRDNGQTKENDIFTMLIRANEDEAGKYQLDDGELIGNVHIMLFAGHDTTAHTLAATLGLLAMYEDIQKDVLEQIVSVVGYDRDPTYEDYSSLDKVLGAFYEALRMFPTVHVMIREASKDTILQIPNPVGQEGSTTIPIPKGTQVIVDMVGVQYNPRYFDEPDKYKPARWYGVSNEPEAFSAFSIGPRACIGRKFATTEAVVFLTMLLRDFDIQPILQNGETKDAWRSRVLDARLELTLGVKDVPLRFTRRKRS